MMPTATIIKHHEPGIYFGMPAEEYHRDPALGSTDIRAIIKSPRRYWLRSWRNPKATYYVDAETKPTVFGEALHCYLLDGRNTFVSKYARRPDDIPNADTNDKSSLTKAAKRALLPGQTLLHGDEWELAEDAGRIITAHPDLHEIFDGGAHEISIFWIDEATGIPMKCRFDVLKPRGIADLKTIANEYDARLDVACKIHVKRYKYHIQAEHYLEGRRQLPRLLDAGKVFLAPPLSRNSTKELELTEACAAEKKFTYVLVFVSKALPEVWATTLTPKNPMLDYARSQINNALDAYTQLLSVVTPAQEWPETWRLSELMMEEMPGGEFGWD